MGETTAIFATLAVLQPTYKADFQGILMKKLQEDDAAIACVRGLFHI